MKKRTISAIVLLAILIGSLFISRKLFGIVILIASIIGFNEIFDIKYKDKLKKMNIIKIIGILCLILIALNNTFYVLDTKVVVLFPLLMLTLPLVLSYGQREAGRVYPHRAPHGALLRRSPLVRPAPLCREQSLSARRGFRHHTPGLLLRRCFQHVLSHWRLSSGCVQVRPGSLDDANTQCHHYFQRRNPDQPSPSDTYNHQKLN